ncbi:hypothetical protein C8R45DRAFT_930775 [Mycena sanguinolenta]|nr:hypothetical protein C8R45DRAFT_930775 [Mycena sanguinolenta]
MKSEKPSYVREASESLNRGDRSETQESLGDRRSQHKDAVDGQDDVDLEKEATKNIANRRLFEFPTPGRQGYNRYKSCQVKQGKQTVRCGAYGFRDDDNVVVGIQTCRLRLRLESVGRDDNGYRSGLWNNPRSRFAFRAPAVMVDVTLRRRGRADDRGESGHRPPRRRRANAAAEAGSAGAKDAARKSRRMSPVEGTDAVTCGRARLSGTGRRLSPLLGLPDGAATFVPPHAFGRERRGHAFRELGVLRVGFGLGDRERRIFWRVVTGIVEGEETQTDLARPRGFVFRGRRNSVHRGDGLRVCVGEGHERRERARAYVEGVTLSKTGLSEVSAGRRRNPREIWVAWSRPSCEGKSTAKFVNMAGTQKRGFTHCYDKIHFNDISVDGPDSEPRPTLLFGICHARATRAARTAGYFLASAGSSSRTGVTIQMRSPALNRPPKVGISPAYSPEAQHGGRIKQPWPYTWNSGYNLPPVVQHANF